MKSRSPKYPFGEGCGHINDHEGVSSCLVLGCTCVTHKDLWIHTHVCMCGVSCREIKESIRLRGKIRNDPKTRRSCRTY
jgi:hypothetical protein